MELLIVGIFSTYYIVRILLYTDKESHFGPFTNENKFIYNSVTAHSQPVSFFDYIRRYTYNPYVIEDNLWTIHPKRMWVWTCPQCLGFWISMAVTIFLYLFYGISLLQLILLPSTFAGGSLILQEIHSGLLWWKEEKSNDTRESE